MTRRGFVLATATLAALGWQAAWAQSASTPPAPAQPVPLPSTPQSTSATYGDWVLNCQRIGEGAAQKKICEVTQTLAAKGQTSPIARIALGRLAPNDPLRFTVQMPVNVAPATVPRLQFGDKAAGASTLAWQRCVPAGCFASVPLDDAALQRVKGSQDQGRIVFHDGADREATLPMSARGLAQALDALAKEDAAK